MSSTWFETVAEAQRRARRRLPKSVYGALLAGTEKGLSVSDNVAAFDELGFAPHVAGLSAERAMATTVMGQPVSLPVLISPTGVQAVHPEGEVAVARAAAARGTAMGLSLVRQQADRGGRGRQPADVLPGVLDRRPGPDRRADRAGSRGWRRGTDRHAGLVVLATAGTGAARTYRSG